MLRSIPMFFNECLVPNLRKYLGNFLYIQF